MKSETIYQTISRVYKRSAIFQICVNDLTFRLTLKQLYDKTYQYWLFYKVDSFNARLIGSCKTWNEVKTLIINWALHHDI